MSARALRLGIDLGTSSVKTLAIDVTGEVVASGEAAFPTLTQVPGQAEQQPTDWLSAVGAASAALARSLGDDWAGRIAAIGLAGQLPTLVAMGEEGALGAAIAWSDGRADAWAAKKLDEERRMAFYRRTGMPIDGRYLAPMFRFHWRDRREAVRLILSAKDYLCFALTGRTLTDPSTAAGYGVHALGIGWAADLCDFWGLDPAMLPPIYPASSLAGGLNAAGARLLGLPESLPVGVGAADSVASALAMGGIEAGTVSLVMGSGTVVIDAVAEPHLDARRRYLLTPHAMAGRYGREMDVLATGSGFRWLGNLLGWTGAEIEAQALASPPGAHGLFFAPYLAGGEQGALWNPALSGVLHGLSLHHERRDIARAFLEGAQFEIRRCVDVLAETSPIARVVVAGHLAQNPALVQMLADVLGRPVVPFASLSPAALGAALLAPGGASSGSNRTRRPDIAPGPQRSIYEAIYRRYCALFPGAALPPAPV